MEAKMRVWLLLLLIGCSPSVPIPPPGPSLDALSFSDAPIGVTGVILTGRADPIHLNAIFYVFDYNRSEGVITKTAADGSFMTRPFGGSDGDDLALFYDKEDGSRSETVCTKLRFNTALVRQSCQ